MKTTAMLPAPPQPRRPVLKAAAMLAACAAILSPSLAFSDPVGDPHVAAPAVRMPNPAPVAVPDFADLVRQLGSDDLSAREAATAAISNDPRITLDELERALMDASLSLEQRSRLEAIGTERFALTPRAALGVTFESRMERFTDGVPITDTTKGFDSHRTLQRGDVIYAMSGKRVRSFEDARRIITSHDPGERVSLKVLRAGQPILVRVGLGSYDDLMRRDDTRPQSRPRGVLLDAWRLRVERRGGSVSADPTAIDTGMQLSDYEILDATVDAANAARLTTDSVSQGAVSANNGVSADVGSRLSPAGGAAVIDLAACSDYASTMRQNGRGDVAALEGKQQALLQEWQMLQLRMREPDRPERERLAINQQANQVRAQLVEIQTQIIAARKRQGQAGRNQLEP